MILKLKKIYISMKNIDLNKTIVSNKVSFSIKGFKHFIGNTEAKESRPFVFFPKMSAYRIDFNET